MGSSSKSSSSSNTSKNSFSLFAPKKSGSLFDSPSTIKKTQEPAKTATTNQPSCATPTATEGKNAASPTADTVSTAPVKNNNNANQDFSKEKLHEIQKQAEKLYVPFKQGEIITVETRRKTYTGAFGGMVGGKLKVGLDLVPTVDLSQDILDRANPDLMMKKQQDFIRKNYYIPKRESEMLLDVSKKE